MSFAVAFIVTIMVTPLVEKIAVRVGAIDIPRDGRRAHKKPIPRLGGLAIFFGFIVSVLMVVFAFGANPAVIGMSMVQMFALLTGALIVVVIGMIDDTIHLNAFTKLIFQVAAAAAVVFSGIKIEIITNPFSNVGVTNLHQYISVPLTILWIVGVTNAINLIDGLDGLAAGISLIASTSLLFISVLSGQSMVAVITATIAGATLGFLPYNFNPARIFMGDTGATFLGFILSVVSIGGTLKAYTAVAIAVPVLVLGLPIFDTVFAILRRAANGKPIMAADRGHLHHRLMDMGLSHRQSVVIMYTISAILGLAAISLVGNWVIRTAVVVVAGVVFTVAAVRYAVKTNVPDTADNIAGEGQSRPEDIPEEEVRKDEAETG